MKKTLLALVALFLFSGCENDAPTYAEETKGDLLIVSIHGYPTNNIIFEILAKEKTQHYHVLTTFASDRRNDMLIFAKDSPNY